MRGWFWRDRNVTLLVVASEGAVAQVCAVYAAWWVGHHASWWLSPPAYVLVLVGLLLVLTAVVQWWFADRDQR